MVDELHVVIRGGGDLSTGVALRLHRVGMRIVILEVAQPTMIRCAISLGTAVYDGSTTVEGTTARHVQLEDQLQTVWSDNEIPVIVDADASSLPQLRPDVLVDAIIAKSNIGTRIDHAPSVVALGPGFTVGVDCHAVVETNRGHNLGRVYYEGAAQKDTGTPGQLGGQSTKRALRAPVAGNFRAELRIGDCVEKGQIVAHVDNSPVVSEIDGVLRGLLHDGLVVPEGMKIADVDPRGVVAHCYTISDKSWAVGGGVLEAILSLRLPNVTK